MKKKSILLCCAILCLALPRLLLAQEPILDRHTSIVTITSFDGCQFEGKLSLPPTGTAKRLIIYVNSSGPHTYDDHRNFGPGLEFNYHDLFAEQLTARGAAYFSYNTRGVTPGDEPPMYVNIDDAAYRLYKPSIQIQDLEWMIAQLLERPELSGAEVYLLGWSEGTFLAPQVVLRGNQPVDALLLAGYMNQSLADTLLWQLTGNSGLVNYRLYYDYDWDGVVSREEFLEDRYGVQGALGDFDELDVTGDGLLTAEDLGLLLADWRAEVLAAFENGDDAWLAANYGVHLTSGWYLDFANFPPNSDTLPKLDLPIQIFHGEFDANVPVEQVISIKEAFRQAGKQNLQVHIFPYANHDLNYANYVTAGVIPDGIQAIIDACVMGLE